MLTGKWQDEGGYANARACSTVANSRAHTQAEVKQTHTCWVLGLGWVCWVILVVLKQGDKKQKLAKSVDMDSCWLKEVLNRKFFIMMSLLFHFKCPVLLCGRFPRERNDSWR